MARGVSSGQAGTFLNSILSSGTPFIQLHVGDPGAAGTANVAANSTRKAATYGTASAGVSVLTTAVTWTAVSNTETYTDWTCWTASSAGTFLFSGTITGGAVTAGNTFTIAIGGASVTLPIAA